MLRSLPPDMQGRYIKLAEVCGSIRNNFAQLSSASQMFVQQMDTRLEGLLRGYVRLLTAAVQQRQYVKSTDPEFIKKEIANLQQKLAHHPPPLQHPTKNPLDIL